MKASARLGECSVGGQEHGGLALDCNGPGRASAIIVGYDGPALPRRLTGSVLEQTGSRSWKLTAEEGAFEFRARGLESLEPRPGLFEGLLAPFALGRRERILVGVLLKLLRLPGGASLLRRWHKGRR